MTTAGQKKFFLFIFVWLNETRIAMYPFHFEIFAMILLLFIEFKNSNLYANFKRMTKKNKNVNY